MTVTPVNNVQHCSPCPPNPDMSSDVCFRLESSEGKMGPELKELESPSAGTGLETPGQQCPPNEVTWNQRRTTADGKHLFTYGEKRGHANQYQKYENYGRHYFSVAGSQTQRR